MRRLPLIIFLSLLVGLLFSACTRRGFSRHSDILRAEKMVRHQPAETKLLLDSLDSIPLDERDRASLALLRLEERYRNDSTPSAVDDSLAAIALDWFQSGSDRFHIMKAHFLSGYNAVSRADYAAGVLSLLEAEQLAEDLDEPYWLGITDRTIGTAYMDIRDFNSANTYFQKMDTAFIEYGDSGYIFDSWRYLAMVQTNMKRCDEAEENLNKALKWAFQTQDSVLIADIFLAYMYNYVEREDYDKVISCADSAAKYCYKEYDENTLYVYTLAYIETGRECEIEGLMTKLEWKKYSMEEIPEKYWLGKGDYKRAYSTLRNAFKVTDSINIIVRKQNLSNTVSQYFATREEMSRLREKNLTITLWIFVLLAIVIVSIIGAVHYRTKSNYNEALHMVASLSATVEKTVHELEESRATRVLSTEESVATPLEENMLSRESLFSLLGERYGELKRLYNAFLIKSGNQDDRDRFRTLLENTLKDLRGPANIEKLGRYVDQYTDDAYSKFIAEFPNLKPEDKAIFVYTVLGFPGNISAALLRTQESNIFNRRSRLRKRILESEMKDRTILLRLMGKKTS